MSKYYHGAGRRGPYFEGWYFKCQTARGEVLALIPAFHISREGQRSASLQVITEGGSWWLEYPDAEFRAAEDRFEIHMGQNVFCRTGAGLHVERDGLSLHGTLRCGPFTPLRSDIMGPFRFVPGMECSHGIISMGHPLYGTVSVNGRPMDFSGGTGYVETDRGRSFPSAYLWTQCVWQGGSLMLSIAKIPMGLGGFTGCICALRCRGREYRLATYRGARVERWSGAGATIRQGKYRLTVEILENNGRPLRAPVEGRMDRTIRESLRAKARYRFWEGKTLLLDHTDCSAGFEYAEDDKRKGAAV